MSFRVDKAWRQRCSQRFRNILVTSLAMHCAEATGSAAAPSAVFSTSDKVVTHELFLSFTSFMSLSCSQDMVAKKADHSVLRLLQISQQHIESQLERVKHERELPGCDCDRRRIVRASAMLRERLWKEVVERRQQQPLQLALSMKDAMLPSTLLTVSCCQADHVQLKKRAM